MSDDGLQLSSELLADLRAVLKKQDQRAEDDIMAMQYLVAAVGMILSSIDNPQLNKKDALKDLSGFMDHVFDYMESQKAAFAPPPAQEAFGVWKPPS
jgi:hypothetical protein